MKEGIGRGIIDEEANKRMNVQTDTQTIVNGRIRTAIWLDHSVYFYSAGILKLHGRKFLYVESPIFLYKAPLRCLPLGVCDTRMYFSLVGVSF